MSPHSHFKRPHGSMFFAQPFAPDGKRYAQMLGLRRFHVFQETLIAHAPKLTRQRLYLAFLWGIDKDSVSVTRKCICCANTELDIRRGEGFSARFLWLALFDKFGHKWLLIICG